MKMTTKLVSRLYFNDPEKVTIGVAAGGSGLSVRFFYGAHRNLPSNWFLLSSPEISATFNTVFARDIYI